MRWPYTLALAATLPFATAAEAANPAERKAVMAEYVELLGFPNVAGNRDDMERLAAHLVKAMDQRGLAPKLLRGPDSKSPPSIYGEWRVPGATKTLVLYAHHDGQPVDPKDWTLSKPFEPTFRTGRPGAWSAPLALPADPKDWPEDLRVFARSASDDKLGVIAIFAAVDRLKAKGTAPSFNLKILFDGEEEAGSPGLPDILAANRGLLRSDGWIIFDGPSHSNGQPQVVLGVRGMTSAELTTFGPNRGLHSGHYGNWAPDPSFRLARLLASMKDRDGRVTVAGFYDDTAPLSAPDRAALAAVPNEDSKLRRELGLAATDSPGQALAETITRPSLDVLGMRSADVGRLARNVIPTTATATLGLRLAKGDDAARQIERLRAHIRKQGFLVLDRDPTVEERLGHPLIAKLTAGTGYNAERTDADHWLVRQVSAAVRSTGPAVVVPTLGGSLPLSLISAGTGAPTLTVSTANYDNNQHAEDENLRIENLWRAIDIVEAILRSR